MQNVLGVHSLETGKLIRQLPLDVGTVVGFSGDLKYSEIFYQFTSFLTPGIIYTLDLKENEEKPKVRIFSEFSVLLLFYFILCSYNNNLIIGVPRNQS